MKLVEAIMTKNPCYTAGRKITVKGLMLHSVGCPQPSGMSFVNSWNSASFDRACVHGFIDANDGTVYQTLPWNHRGWHAGGAANNTHIGVEMCEPSCIKYTSGAVFTCWDKPTAIATAQRTYDAAVELFAMLCKEYSLDPMADGVIVSHREGYRRGIASNHGDPEHMWLQLGMPLTMDTFREAVLKAMGGVVPEQEEPTTQPEDPDSTTIKVGDLVRITGSQYYIGKTIPGWVKAKLWYVHAISGDCVTINKSEDGINAIMSPVRMSDLALVTATETPEEIVGGSIYTVVKGDTLWLIAKQQLGSGARYVEIVKMNELKTSTIYPGQVLKMPE